MPPTHPVTFGGWHTLLELLGHSVDGRPVAWTMRRWEQHRDCYAATVPRP